METRATLLLRLRAEGPVREVAWSEFCDLYEPVIAAFARARGVARSDIADLVQSVLLGFFAVQPRFSYDPSKGRFRSYLRTCVVNQIRTRARASGRALIDVDPDECSVEYERDWDSAWRDAALDRAVRAVRAHYRDNTTFLAFEAVVLRDQDPEVVARTLGISRDSVYQAKSRVLARLRLELDAVEQALDGES